MTVLVPDRRRGIPEREDVGMIHLHVQFRLLRVRPDQRPDASIANRQTALVVQIAQRSPQIQIRL
jgi:hypothetical protein